MKKNYKKGSVKRIEETKEFWESERNVIISDLDNWKKFLEFSSQIYKYDFTTQILAKAQNLSSTMLADFEIWNKHDRRIEKQAKSIAAFDISNKNMLMHIYDISQTYGHEYTKPKIFKLETKDISKFIKKYNYKNNSSFKNFKEIIDFETKIALEDILSDENKNLLSEDIQLTLIESSKYTIYSRNNTENINEIRDFELENMVKFIGNDERKLVYVGNILNKTSYNVLKEMEVIIKEIYKENVIENSKKEIKNILEEKNKEKTVENSKTSILNKIGINNSKEEIKEKIAHETIVEFENTEINVNISNSAEEEFIEKQELIQLGLFDLQKKEEINIFSTKRRIELDDEIEINGRKFTVSEIDLSNDKIKLLDNSLMIPIIKVEYGIRDFLERNNLEIKQEEILDQKSREDIISEEIDKQIEKYNNYIDKNDTVFSNEIVIEDKLVCFYMEKIRLSILDNIDKTDFEQIKSNIQSEFIKEITKIKTHIKEIHKPLKGTEKFNLKNGSVVEIEWSDFDLIENNIKNYVPFTTLNQRIKDLDEFVNLTRTYFFKNKDNLSDLILDKYFAGLYHTTKYSIHFLDDKGTEKAYYDINQSLGDGEGDIVNHLINKDIVENKNKKISDIYFVVNLVKILELELEQCEKSVVSKSLELDKKTIDISNEEYVKQLFSETEEVAYQGNDEYIHIIETDGGFNYSIYDMKTKALIDGGLFETDSNLENALDEILTLAEIDKINISEIYLDVFEEFIDLDSEIASQEQVKNETKINFKLGETNEIDKFSPKLVAKDNIEAIKKLKEIEKENRLATPEEQEILKNYRGFGGIPQIFDEKNQNFKSEYFLLKDILNDKEYKSARGSVNNAHYTDPEIIKVMYQAFENFGFEKGKILEPSMGVGNFFSALPDKMSKSKLYGVELDDISGRISKQLYQKAQISISGFEETGYTNNFFDVAIGNVPFGNYKVFDKEYNKHNLNIHDYFFLKAIDKLKVGGILAFITSKGTLDKLNSKARKLFSEKADLLGAIRLPNTAFKGVANTDVTSDIIFLQKREVLSILEPSWVNCEFNYNGIQVNNYFLENPDMILGEMQIDEKRKGIFGENSKVTTCINEDPNFNLIDQLKIALKNIKGEIVKTEIIQEKIEYNAILEEVLLNNNFDNYSYQNINGKAYFYENNRLEKYNGSDINEKRILGLIEIRSIVEECINAQTKKCSDLELKEIQTELNQKYNQFIKKYGNISDQKNQVFKDDDRFNLLCTLENKLEDGSFEKAEIFTERTIYSNSIPKEVDTVHDALAISLNEKGFVDLQYMSSLYNENIEQMISELEEEIFMNPEKYNSFDIYQGYEISEEYLSGNIKEKIDFCNKMLEKFELEEDINSKETIRLKKIYEKNIKKLNSVMPVKIEAQDIDVRLGSTWINPSDIENFMYEKFETPKWNQRQKYEWRGGSTRIVVDYHEDNSTWKIENKYNDRGNIQVEEIYGTSRTNAYSIVESTLNLQSVSVKDRVEESDGKVKYVLNKKETLIAREKQTKIKEEFVDWIWKDADRRNYYVEKYNSTFNTIKPREYDGTNLHFSGKNPKINLRKHQKDAVARIIFGKNTLLGHVVGAGKSFTMIAGIMEQKRLGISNKSLMVVPNHLTGQMGIEFLRLYPNAKILVPTKKDFEKNNRQKLISKIAIGNYDAVIIGHSQFEKIKVSPQRQERMINEEIESLENVLMEVSHSDRLTVKRLERQKKSLMVQLQKLTDDTKKDKFINFEQLGIDSLVVDEAHMYKNGAINTKMQNVSGLGSKASQRSMDMLMKCQYIQEINNGRGIVFATGTPISNSMAEMYVMQKYLQPEKLKELGIRHFDQWAANFGETISSLELAPEGSGYRIKNKFAKFFNLPELMSIFREVADIKMSGDLNLPVPKLKENKYKIVAVKPVDVTKKLMMGFAERSELIRSGSVDPKKDNMLKITNEARLLGTDPRLLDVDFTDEELEELETTLESKLNMIIENSHREYLESKETKGTQIIFSDIGTPNTKKQFTVYDYLKKSLVEKGIPEEEICFIHDAKNEKQRDEIFEDMKQGNKRIIIGSTAKMGTGTNIQDRLIALHHVDCPYRPSDIEQREGRILRQGNMNEEVSIYRYVTKDTFDAYLWQMVENKQRFISQVMTSKTPLRNCEDLDEFVFSCAEVKALAIGDDRIKDKMQLDNDITQLKMLKASFDSQKYQNQDKINIHIPAALSNIKEKMEHLKIDLETSIKHTKEDFVITIKGVEYKERTKAGEVLKNTLRNVNTDMEFEKIGIYKGLDLVADLRAFNITKTKDLLLKGKSFHDILLGESEVGNITRIENITKSIEGKIEHLKKELDIKNKSLEVLKEEIKKPFEKQELLEEKLIKVNKLNMELEIKEGEEEIIFDEEEIKIEEIIKEKEIERETKNIEEIDKNEIKKREESIR